MITWFSKKTAVITDEKRIDELLSRSVTEAIVKDDLKKALMLGKPLRIKLGIDPTSPNIHLGRAVALLKLKDFQDLGHEIVLIVGDSTGVIGDTSDKNSERPMLSEKVIQENLKTYFDQVGKVLDMSRVEKHRNSEWLSKLTYQEIGEHADAFSVSDFIARENISKRLESGLRVSLREVLYPLMQGYDSVAVKADVEIGGNDQRFNLLAGRKLQERFDQRPQNILMVELISGLDGRKMSSSWGNTINLTDTANDMFGKVMSLRDDLVHGYFIHCTRLPMSEIAQIEQTITHPKDLKMRLGFEITKFYHGEEKASEARMNFEDTFSKGGVPNDVEEVTVKNGSDLGGLLIEKQLVKSKSEWRRLVLENAVSHVEGETITDPAYTVSRDAVIKVGKRRFLRIKVQ